MTLWFASAAALVFMACGILIYRLGVSDGVTLRKSGTSGLFSKKNTEVHNADDWQSIISYDHRK